MYKKHPAIFTGTVLSDTRCSFIKSTNKRDRAYVYVHHSSAPLSIMFSLSFDRFSFHKLAKETFPISRYEHRVNLRSFPSSLFLFLSFFFLMKKQLLDNGNAGLDYSLSSPLLPSIFRNDESISKRSLVLLRPEGGARFHCLENGRSSLRKTLPTKKGSLFKKGKEGKEQFRWDRGKKGGGERKKESRKESWPGD